MCRIAITFGILFTYPVVFIGYRDGVFDLRPLSSARETSPSLNLMTLLLLAIVMIVAIFFDDLGLVNVVGGGTIATAVEFVFPTLMFRAAVKHKQNQQLQQLHLGQQQTNIRESNSSNNKYPTKTTVEESREGFFAMSVMWLGIAMGVTGMWVALNGR